MLSFLFSGLGLKVIGGVIAAVLAMLGISSHNRGIRKDEREKVQTQARERAQSVKAKMDKETNKQTSWSETEKDLHDGSF